MLNPASNSAWPQFRRAFLWALAAFALLWSLRTEADEVKGPILCDTPPVPTVQPPAAEPQPSVEPTPVPLPPSDAAVPPMPPLPAEALEPLPPNSALAPKMAPPVDTFDDVPGASVVHFPEENWTVTILPRQLSPSDQMRQRYDAVYASIPYRREEYLANPGYRHESTLELMFGQLRPKTVVSQYTPRTVPTQPFTKYKPYMHSVGEIYNRWYPSYAPYSFGFPLSPFYPAYPSRFPVYY